MFDNNNKKFKPNCVFDLSLNPVPRNIKVSLDYISKRFYSPFLRNLEILYNTNGDRLYGLMTSYVGKNFCWIQPTQVKSSNSDVDYNRYVKRINTRCLSYIDPEKITVGMDCLVKYDADSYWYRGIVIKELSNHRWLVTFVDYGNFQICDVSKIAEPIVEQDYNHYKVPVQAVCCRLYNIVPTLPHFREDIDIYLQRFFEERNQNFLEIVIREIRQDYVIDCDIFLPRARTDGPGRLYRRHIGQELVDAGLATFADPFAAQAIRVPAQEMNKNNNPDLMEFDTQQDISAYCKILVN